PAGGSSTASRSTATAGSAIASAASEVIKKGCVQAAEILEAPLIDIEYADGHFYVTGTDRCVPLFELAERAAPKGSAETLDTVATTDTTQTFPNGCHIAEVEIDPE